jgi:hypothetical protein
LTTDGIIRRNHGRAPSAGLKYGRKNKVEPYGDATIDHRSTKEPL